MSFDIFVFQKGGSGGALDSLQNSCLLNVGAQMRLYLRPWRGSSLVRLREAKFPRSFANTVMQSGIAPKGKLQPLYFDRRGRKGFA